MKMLVTKQRYIMDMMAKIETQHFKILLSLPLRPLSIDECRFLRFCGIYVHVQGQINLEGGQNSK